LKFELIEGYTTYYWLNKLEQGEHNISGELLYNMRTLPSTPRGSISQLDLHLMQPYLAMESILAETGDLRMRLQFYSN